MDIVFVGIDPGKGGAVALIDGNKVELFETPLEETKKGKEDYNIAAMAAILKPLCGRKVHAIIEAVFSMSGQGVSSTFNFGRGKGLWEGICAAYGFDVTMASPMSWKKHYEGLIVVPLSKEIRATMPKKDIDRNKRLAKAGAKTKARELASQLFPVLASSFIKVKDDGKAEALLIANYGRNTWSKNGK